MKQICPQSHSLEMANEDFELQGRACLSQAKLWPLLEANHSVTNPSTQRPVLWPESRCFRVCKDPGRDAFDLGPCFYFCSPKWGIEWGHGKESPLCIHLTPARQQ